MLVVVIFMIVSLTVILSLTLRSVNNIRMSTEEDNSKRAFSAAEAGIEIMLNTKSNITESINLLNNSSISKGTRTIIEDSTFLINGENLLKKMTEEIFGSFLLIQMGPPIIVIPGVVILKYIGEQIHLYPVHVVMLLLR